MKLAYRCPSCKATNYYTPVIATRGDLHMKIGDNFAANCTSCNSKEKVHINKITAVHNKKLILIGAAIGCITAVILWSIFGAIGTVALGVPILFMTVESSATNSFNKYMIRRR
ncbi:hypothetical protein M4I21_16950 [Cellulophaga sp. 20_2_10]|uniref:hypothetical protein n=1 Tax=Cellulophaga sp. 20_2_10 TaxID=2942476 RepID=UPI00201A681B|nr:hypothetical protein [Cellulophaga sp. 20_2_10]MCL5247512.1 hypothetical protein [Cellulophaga sp. 20_2_10]